MCQAYNPYAMFAQAQQPAMNKIAPYSQTQQPVMNQPASFPMASMPIQTDIAYSGGVDQVYNREYCLMNDRAHIDIQRHMKKKEIDEEYLAQMIKFKADVQIKSNLLSNTIVVTEEGGIIRRQEYLLEKPKDYFFANFKIAGRPIRYINKNSQSAVLYLSAVLQNQRNVYLYLDLEKGGVGYFWRKFLKVGISFRKKRDESRDFIFDILQAIIESAEVIALPQHRGFYRSTDGTLRYAGRTDVIWEDVVCYAK